MLDCFFSSTPLGRPPLRPRARAAVSPACVRSLRDILDHLQIPEPDTVETQLDLVRRYWRKRSGDWHAMVLRARDLKIAVSKRGSSGRHISPEILDDVFGKDKKADANSNG